jgi:hypothetical protein
MRTKKLIQLSLLLFGVLAIAVTSCKKDNSSATQTTDKTTSLQNQSTDETRVSQASDEVTNDVNIVMSGQSGMKSTEGIPCNATLDSTAVINDTMTYYITYNGLSCNGHLFRTGQVEIKRRVNTWWHQAGTTIVYTFINYHVYRVLHPEKALTINGTRFYENVTGGLLWMVGQYIDSVQHKQWGYMDITFEDSTHRTWHFDRQLTFTRVNQMLVLRTDGLGAADGYTNLVVWGVNRNGEQFYDQVLQTNVFKQKCDWDPCSGIKKIMIPGNNKSATLTWGYDSNNQLITNDDCPTKFRVDYTVNGQSGTIYLFLP